MYHAAPSKRKLRVLLSIAAPQCASWWRRNDAMGQKRRSWSYPAMSALPPKATAIASCRPVA